jgi:hydroxymethylbilane synthase
VKQSRLRIGTRASALARWQAEHVAAAIRRIPGAPEPELVLIKTEGDAIQDIPLYKLQGKAFFTKEIEEALLLDRIDVAVHSLKDLATTFPPELALSAVMEREDPRDALLFGASFGSEALDDMVDSGGVGGSGSSDAVGGSGGPRAPDALPRGSRVGTSSLRRRALLARWRPDLQLMDLRGNVPTRIEKLDRGDYDAIVLASAGVKRLGLGNRISAFLPFDIFLPAVSQGAVGVQTRADDVETRRWTDALDHPPTRAATNSERALLRRVEGGCQVPVGAFAEVEANALRLRGVVCSLDGTTGVEGEVTGDASLGEALGVSLAEDLLARGGKEILDGIRRGVNGD